MRRIALACTFAVALGLTAGTAPSAGAQAARVGELRSELNSAGDRLSRATEAYDQAKLKREQLDARLGNAQADVSRTDAQLKVERGKLGVAVRQLYEHPFGGIDTFYSARSFGELQRGNVLASHVALSTDDVLLGFRKAKAEEQAATSHLQQLRDQAQRDELAMANEKKAAIVAFQRTQGLLGQANGELAAELEAERRAGLAGAGALANKYILNPGPVSPGASTAVRTARAQIGKPYQWGAAGPSSFDCSGLTMYAWSAAGVGLPHSAEAQYSSLPHVALSQLAPGDLVFFGSPIHHVGIYEGGGIMIEAPQTGEVVREASIWRNPVGAARP